jgi:cold shock CspA family protein
MSESKLIRVGVFYDGNYFFHVSNYYNYSHARKARLSVTGVHEFIRSKVVELEGEELRFCQIVDAHYFRGRFSAQQAGARQKLLTERVFDDVLMREGIVTHYLPMTKYGEKGIDVWLSLEAFELAVLKRFDVLVLIACDGDYVPLVRKVNTLGSRVMVLGWDFEYVDDAGNPRKTITSINLLDEVTYPILMHDIINDKTKRNDSVVNGLFVNRDARENDQIIQPVVEPEKSSVGGHPVLPPGDTQKIHRGPIITLKEGYGFVGTDVPQKNLFFFWTDLIDVDFNDLKTSELVEYKVGRNNKGECAKEVKRVSQ